MPDEKTPVKRISFQVSAMAVQLKSSIMEAIARPAKALVANWMQLSVIGRPARFALLIRTTCKAQKTAPQMTSQSPCLSAVNVPPESRNMPARHAAALGQTTGCGQVRNRTTPSTGTMTT